MEIGISDKSITRKREKERSERKDEGERMDGKGGREGKREEKRGGVFLYPFIYNFLKKKKKRGSKVLPLFYKYI